MGREPTAPFEKVGSSRRGGKTPGSGRKPGVPNRLTASVKDAVSRAFDEVGGAEYLMKVAKDDPRTFCGLLGKMLPLQLTGDKDNPLYVADAVAERKNAVLAKLNRIAEVQRNGHAE